VLPRTLVAEYLGELINVAEAERRDNSRSPCYSPFIMHSRDDKYIDGANGGNATRFINHSCVPNCAIRRSRGRVFIFTRRAVAAGAELTIDYAFDRPSGITCCCGAAWCRGRL
jgi:hypothetical protein